ncbi:unnamed protein product [Blepharisma stoltei]|uniref:5'-nucleotidase n=1 Tax=Blepharisma stoltei TaxID=1481888 RepID=A0AAU9JJA9_9CILI|nr:unnamed protein product [Blepharisma stoltei]
MSASENANIKVHRRPIIAPYNDQEAILIPNPEVFRRKLHDLVNGGSHNVEVISDYDFTLSRFRIGNQKGKSTYQVVEAGALSGDKLQETHDLYSYYHPIEVDPHIPHDEKERLMHEWWDKSNEIILSVDIHRSMLYDFIMDSNLHLRHGVDRVLHHCDRNLIPFTIISAGCGNIIEVSLEEYLEHEKLEIHSNFMIGDCEGRYTHWSEPALRTLNKNLVLRDRPVKPNIILLGDMISDIKMIEHATYNDALKIGFLNEPSSYVLDAYKEAYDILILNDGNMSLIELILSLVTGEAFNIDDYPSLQALKDYLPSLVRN